jgi:hypothetical protein
VQNIDNISQLDTLPPPITTALDEFSKVIVDPSELPPHREYDHTIPLLPNFVPMKSRPYRYSPLHKDEIERQVRHFLQTGLISHSTSHFASQCY